MEKEITEEERKRYLTEMEIETISIQVEQSIQLLLELKNGVENRKNIDRIESNKIQANILHIHEKLLFMIEQYTVAEKEGN